MLDEGEEQQGDDAEEPAAVYADAAYGTGELLDRLERDGVTAMIKVQAANAPGGHFTKDEFAIDLRARTAICPAGITVALRPRRGGAQAAVFGPACASCALAPRCTDSPAGRVVNVGPHEALLRAARRRRNDPDFSADYRATRPKVERKLGHLMRRRHGGRRARVRGIVRVAQDFAWLAAAVNLRRIAILGSG